MVIPLNWFDNHTFLPVQLIEDGTNTDARFCYLDGETLWGYSGSVLKKSTNNGTTWSSVYDLTDSIVGIYVTSTGAILCWVQFDDSGTTKTKIMRSTNESDWSQVYLFDRECRPLNSITEHPTLGIFYGEYLGASNDYVTVINSTDDGANWSVVKQWDFYYAGTGNNAGDHVRHVHFVGYDSHEGLIWVATGDEDSQCRLYTYDGVDWVLIGSGTQAWRFVSLLFYEDYIIMPTDAMAESGAVFVLDRNTRNVSTLGDRMDSYCLFALKTDSESLIFTESPSTRIGLGTNNVYVYSANNETLKTVTLLEGTGLVPTVNNPYYGNGYLYLSGRGIGTAGWRFIRYRIENPHYGKFVS